MAVTRRCKPTVSNAKGASAKPLKPGQDVAAKELMFPSWFETVQKWDIGCEVWAHSANSKRWFCHTTVQESLVKFSTAQDDGGKREASKGFVSSPVATV
ncbi:hypothetical protein PHLCEN_2v10152 [Hermanssonia centrifuga]|uniref:Uncharacterized protein n=1 Tax=Hermanssonia centrifuga TaxID=98765 RepID=A0A2R6NNT8_9APHY|nr:hypothetical protein PHLCEN_2v10152 [Hermanssonia centrifuga]